MALTDNVTCKLLFPLGKDFLFFLLVNSFGLNSESYYSIALCYHLNFFN